nr:protein GREB1 [Oryctolagus cuniculus]
MESPDLPGIGGPALHPLPQWGGPAQGVLVLPRPGSRWRPSLSAMVMINSSCLARMALEQELGLAAHFVSSELPSDKGPRSEDLESDTEKLSSTDNKEEEPGTEDGLKIQ